MTSEDMTPEERQPRPLWVDSLILGFAGIVFVTLILLGNWQMRRLAWKLDLIETVEARRTEEAVAAPLRVDEPEDLAYLRVTATGEFQHHLSRRVKALTDLGGGSWLMTPLRTVNGHIWINRGFIPAGSEPSEWTTPTGTVEIEGLLRVSEPEGTLLEKNDAEAGRWYSRDVTALSEDTGAYYPAPYFIDSDHYGGHNSWPRGGLTVVNFRNSHLSYALTWYTMALLFFGAMAWVVRDRMKASLS
ncbi:MAG: SURF1 family protein [Pseudomonadota bacterium]